MRANFLTVKSMLSTNVSPLGVLIGTPCRTMLNCDVTIKLKWNSARFTCCPSTSVRLRRRTLPSQHLPPACESTTIQKNGSKTE